VFRSEATRCYRPISSSASRFIVATRPIHRRAIILLKTMRWRIIKLPEQLQYAVGTNKLFMPSCDLVNYRRALESTAGPTSLSISIASAILHLQELSSNCYGLTAEQISTRTSALSKFSRTLRTPPRRDFRATRAQVELHRTSSTPQIIPYDLLSTT
jgi:hypothetical protein